MRIAVLHDHDGVLAAGLRRTGLHFRFPVHPDAAAAAQALAAERDARAERSLAARPARRSPETSTTEPDPGVANPARHQVA
jgi:hypothetical protein